MHPHQADPRYATYPAQYAPYPPTPSYDTGSSFHQYPTTSDGHAPVASRDTHAGSYGGYVPSHATARPSNPFAGGGEAGAYAATRHGVYTPGMYHPGGTVAPTTPASQVPCARPYGGIRPPLCR
jgi:hypothetical protein